MSHLAVAAQEPPDLRTPKGAADGRVEIILSVGIEVMTAMMGRPPERPFLLGRRSQKGQKELENPAGSVGAVRKEPMKPGGDREHAHQVKAQTRDHSHRAHARPDESQTSQMQKEKLRAD